MDQHLLGDLARRRRVALIVQFGSSVTGALHARSDLDLAVLFESHAVSFAELTELECELSALLPGTTLDVAVLNWADPLFLKKILETGRLLFGEERRFLEWKLYAFRRYQDHRRYLRLERDFLRRRLGTTPPSLP